MIIKQSEKFQICIKQKYVHLSMYYKVMLNISYILKIKRQTLIIKINSW